MAAVFIFLQNQLLGLALSSEIEEPQKKKWFISIDTQLLTLSGEGAMLGERNGDTKMGRECAA